MSDPNEKRTDKNPGAPRGLSTGQDWPACRYSPDGEARIFHSAAEVPEGWEDHPKKHHPEAVQERAERAKSLSEREVDLTKRESVFATLKAEFEASVAAFAKAREPEQTPAAPKPVAPKGPRPVLKMKAAPKPAPAVETKANESEPLVVLGDEDNEDEGE